MVDKKGNKMTASDRDMAMYGMSTEDIKSQYIDSMTAKFSGMEMVVMGILSDCQEMMGMCSPNVPQPRTNEYLRKQMNIAKYILCEMMDQKEKQ